MGQQPLRDESKIQAGHKLFYGLRPDECAEICRLSRGRTYATGEVIYRAGGPVRQVALLTGGVVKVTHLSSNGNEIILRFGSAGDVIGALELFSTDFHHTTTEAFRASRTLVWDSSLFLGLVQRYPRLLHNLAQSAGQLLFQLGERFCDVATERVSARVARQVMRLIDQVGHVVDGQVDITLSREDMAKMTGTTQFTVSRLFAAWDAAGMIKTRRQGLTICDVKSLQAQCRDIDPSDRRVE